MVESPVAQNTLIRVTDARYNSKTFIASPADIVDGVTITWGRKSLFKGPDERRAAFTLRMRSALEVH